MWQIRRGDDMSSDGERGVSIVAMRPRQLRNRPVDSFGVDDTVFDGGHASRVGRHPRSV